MPRTLPWLADAAKQKSQKSTAHSSTPASKRKIGSSDEEDLVDDDLNVLRPATPERKPKKRANRTPSTSPPPAPPDVEFMREGYNADDAYLMVEDEFLSVAKAYTQHIHHAEYVRLKKLARFRGAGTLNAVSRPTDGRTQQSTALKMKLEAAENGKKINKGLKQLGDDESSDVEDDYMRDPQLAGLMTMDHQVRKDLSDISKTKSNTRAAAGFSQSPHNIERKKDALAVEIEVFSDDTDDLDSAPPRKTKSSVTKSKDLADLDDGHSRSIDSARPRSTTESSSVFKRFAKASAKEDGDNMPKVSRRSPLRTSKLAETALGGPQPSDADGIRRSSSAPDYLTKRRLEHERKEREERRKAKKLDEVPTFLI
jgi:hypothetical protein